jgi:Tfp pilus assembly protein PilO
MNLNISKNISSSLVSPGGSARNSFIEVGLLIIICVLFFWFIILPKKASKDLKQNNLNKLQDQEKTMADKLAKLQQMVVNLKSNPQALAELDEAMPLEANVTRLQVLVNYLAQSVNVSVGDISLYGKADAVVAGNKALLNNPYGATRTLQKISGSVYVVGNFNQLQSFLEKIEKDGRILEITDLNMDGASNGNLNLKIGLNAYYLAP